MASAIHYCLKHKLINPPKFIETNLCFETAMGSFAYGCSQGGSDQDIYGVVIPPKDILFPHLSGYMPYFDNEARFEQWQEHHVNDKSSGKEFDFSVYNIAIYFKLLYDNNPNILDSLFVPEFCVKHITKVGHLLRDNRKLFLSKRILDRYRGYACSQAKKIEAKSPTGKRVELVEKHGYDTKFAYHLIRLLDEASQILVDHDLDLTRNNGEWKAIRNGEWSYEKLMAEFEMRKLAVEEKAKNSTLREKPDKDRIRDLLFECLEIQYGSVGDVVSRPDSMKNALKDIDLILNKVKTEIYK